MQLKTIVQHAYYEQCYMLTFMHSHVYLKNKTKQEGQ